MALHHVNFHTVQRMPVFDLEEYDAMMRATIKTTLRERRIVCLAWELMPSHLHAIVEDFHDFSLRMILQFLKGDTSRAFFRAFPELRADLLGGHLWSKGYWEVRIQSHQQFCATLDYVRTNRERADLPLPASLQSHGVL